MNFYPWHTDIYTQLTSAFLNGRGHHALLFKSEQGVGAESMIRTFAQWLLCTENLHISPCEQCKSCVLWASGNHPDFHVIEPIEGKDIGVEQIRALTIELQQFARQGGNSVVYLRGAQRLTESAANALLKTLEEPPENVYFLLEAPLQSPLLATIQSRCQTWLLNAPDTEQAFAWLRAEFASHSQEDLAAALRLCHFRPLICKNFLETDRLQARKTFLQTFWRFFKSRDVWLLLSAFDKEKEGALEQLEWLGSFFSDSLKAAMQVSVGWTNADLAKGVEAFGTALSPQRLLKGYQILQQTERELREINAVNIELMLADCLTKLVLTVFE